MVNETETGILAGLFSPPLLWQFAVAGKLLSEHRTVTFAVLIAISDPTEQHWPSFESGLPCCMNIWERTECLMRGIESCHPKEAGRFVVVPVFTWNEEVLFNRTFFPRRRTWYFVSDDLNQVAHQLVSRGESVSIVDTPKAYQSSNAILERIANGLPCADWIHDSTSEYLDEILLKMRLESHFSTPRITKEGDYTMSDSRGGMQFNGPVHVQGNVINIEGNQYNFKSDSKERVVSAIGQIVRAGLEGGDVVELVSYLEGEIQERHDISETDIALGVKLAVEKPDELQTHRLSSLLADLMVGASGSMLGSGIIAGIKLILGMP